jgi:hypothetical protein
MDRACDQSRRSVPASAPSYRFVPAVPKAERPGRTCRRPESIRRGHLVSCVVYSRSNRQPCGLPVELRPVPSPSVERRLSERCHCDWVRRSVLHQTIRENDQYCSVSKMRLRLAFMIMAKDARIDRSEQVMKAWMNAECGHPPRKCPKCGVAMTNKFGRFFFANGQAPWTMSLPVCPNRNPSITQIVGSA